MLVRHLCVCVCCTCVRLSACFGNIIGMFVCVCVSLRGIIGVCLFEYVCLYIEHFGACASVTSLVCVCFSEWHYRCVFACLSAYICIVRACTCMLFSVTSLVYSLAHVALSDIIGTICMFSPINQCVCVCVIDIIGICLFLLVQTCVCVCVSH